ncbi:MAG: amidohydrolase family protein, partial [Nitrospirae bacterium]|nr:amidohydrolase family protein [Nitrospirota bacterium]
WGLALVLAEEGVLTVEQVVSALTIQPARAFGLAKGTLAVGADADVTIVDPEAQWVVDPEQFKSKGRNTPFAGWKLKGRVVSTLVGGRVVHP